ncbi:hypothetical protein D9M70_297500 [compost metagenome]
MPAPYIDGQGEQKGSFATWDTSRSRLANRIRMKSGSDGGNFPGLHWATELATRRMGRVAFREFAIPISPVRMGIAPLHPSYELLMPWRADR